MINPINVKDYINFLHLKKYSAPATEELKNRWASVPEQELATQLQGLYQHWGIDPQTAAAYELQFLQGQQGYAGGAPPPQPADYRQPYHPQPAAPQPTTYHYAAPQPRSNRTAIIILSALLVLGAAGFAAYWLSGKKDQANVPAAASDTTATAVAPPNSDAPAQNATEPERSAPTPVVVDEGEDIDEQDEANMEVIKNLIRSEESRNMSAILNSFSPDMEQYWDISYPSQEELVKRYNAVWSKSGNGRHNNVRLEKTGDHTYDMFADYEFYSTKDHISKAVNVHVRYVFDGDNRIVKTFGVQ